ncbi:MAG: CHAT domain-containing protein, partial [Bacteroidales bacterium]
SYLLLKHGEDYKKAEEILLQILPYTESNYHDTRVKTETYLYLSTLMHKTGRSVESLDYINMVLDDSLDISSRYMVLGLVQKSRVLHEMYSSGGGGIQDLKASLSAAEEAIGIIEKTRLEINEDESRSRISGRFDDAYNMGMLVLYELYSITGDRNYLERSVIISEKSKAAGLLAATRNNRSMNFRLPQELAEMEKQLLSDIRDYNEVVYSETAKPEPDPVLIDHYKMLSFKSATVYDSLVQVFKEDYPRYYDLKYNTSVSSPDDIKRNIGRSGDFIEYYMSDSLLYIMLVNDDTTLLEKVDLPGDFRKKLLAFRDILVNPAINGGARAQYNEYLSLSYYLYKMFILPVKDHLISDRMVVSPDGLMYYIPFETLISSVPDTDEINYRELDYLLNEYEIFYEYSGTLMTETPSPKAGIWNSVVSFAPDYSGGMDIDDIMQPRQSGRDSLANIPGAREEAVFINKLMGGSLYIDSQATESAFKRNAVEGDIVHMAMHTLLNDNNPMYSRMVFSTEIETDEDGMLNTYEVYNLDINAKMVFLSSCNTGSGYLQSGEGVMSLARGFFYSGSPSVIMSLWEVDDLSGNTIVKNFYRNIKKGRSKSHSLRQARMEYLKEADQMRSHPYFWSTLVIIGDDSPVYYTFHKYIIILVLMLAGFLTLRYYYRLRKE